MRTRRGWLQGGLAWALGAAACGGGPAGARAAAADDAVPVASGSPAVIDAAADRVWTFAVLNQRSVNATAALWNPILDWVSRHSGVTLALAMGKTAVETTERTVAGAYDFAYTNHLFTPERAQLGWRVLARFNRPAIHGVIIVAEASPIASLSALAGKAVVFPSREAMVAYRAPRLALEQAGVRVVERFAGHQEAALQQLASGAADAAGVNEASLHAYAARVAFRTRTLWRSPPFPDLPVMAHPRVPAAIVTRVRSAMLRMANDPQGRRILDDAGALLAVTQPLAFVAASDADYDVYRRLLAAGAGSRP